MKPISDLLGDPGRVAVGAVVENEVHSALVFCRLVNNPCGVLYHFQVKHAADHLVKWEGLGVGFLVAHPRS